MKKEDSWLKSGPDMTNVDVPEGTLYILPADFGENQDDYFKKLLDISKEEGKSVRGSFSGLDINITAGDTLEDIKQRYDQAYLERFEAGEKEQKEKIEGANNEALINSIDEINDEEDLLDWFNKYDLVDKNSFKEDRIVIFEKFRNKNLEYVPKDPSEFSGEPSSEIVENMDAYATYVVQLGLTSIQVSGEYPRFSHGFYRQIEEWKKSFGKESEKIKDLRTKIKDVA